MTRTNTPRRSWLPSITTVAAVAVAAIAAAMAFTSFAALADLARSTGLLTGTQALALPVALDGMVLVASLAVVARRKAGQPAVYSWTLVGLFTALSIAGNIAHAWPRGPVAVAIAAVFPTTLFLAFEQLLAIVAPRGRRHPAAKADADLDAHLDADATLAAKAQAAASAWAAADPAEALLAAAAEGAPAALSAHTGADSAPPAGRPGARARIRALLDAHHAAGGDPAELTGPAVAAQVGCSLRRAQELLAELRAEPTSTGAAR